MSVHFPEGPDWVRPLLSFGGPQARSRTRATCVRRNYRAKAGREIYFQGPGETEFVPVGVGDVEVALAPAASRGAVLGWYPAASARCVQRVHVGVVEDRAAPPGPLPLRRLGGEIEVTRARAEAGEAALPPPSSNWKPSAR